MTKYWSQMIDGVKGHLHHNRTINTDKALRKEKYRNASGTVRSSSFCHYLWPQEEAKSTQSVSQLVTACQKAFKLAPWSWIFLKNHSAANSQVAFHLSDLKSSPLAQCIFLGNNLKQQALEKNKAMVHSDGELTWLCIWTIIHISFYLYRWK